MGHAQSWSSSEWATRSSDTAYPSLGTHTGNSTTAQHCRAEVYVNSHGWIPVDPADVRKVILEEPGNLSLTTGTVEAARAQLFGSWEMNWMAYNYAQDVSLPGASGPPLKFLCTPNARVQTDGSTASIQRTSGIELPRGRFETEPSFASRHSAVEKTGA